MNLPNRLTITRVALIPIFVGVIRLDTFWAYCLSLAIFVGAALTDYYDGKIARRRGSVTNFGKLFDPVADKILVAAAFISFLDKEYLAIPSWVVVVILGRELLVTGLRSIAASNGVIISAGKLGKLKTVSQMGCAITVLALMLGREAILEFFESPSARFISLYDHGMRVATFVLIMLAMLFTVASALRLFQEHGRLLVTPGAE